MLVASIVLYLVISIAIGLWASSRVKSSQDYMVAGRSLPIYVVLATVFATWFGSETVLGTSSVFIQDGLLGVIADPFGAALCLVIVGLFFAVKLYRMRLNTIADYYRERYNKGIELFTSIAVMISYFGWVAAQLTALGLVFNIVTNGSVSPVLGILIGTAIVVLYTIWGGMWSVAMTDFFQMIVIVVGLSVIAVLVSSKVDGGATAVVQHAYAMGKLNPLPEWSWAGVLGFVGALITLGLGSVPQQDVFQRVMSAKDEKTARNGAVWGGVFYLLFAFVPIYLAYTAFLIDPVMVRHELSDLGDSQRVLPNLIMQHTPVMLQVLFFGALLSAIMSTASGTLLAPSSVFVNNILKHFLIKDRTLDDKQTLLAVRVSVLLFAIVITLYALLNYKRGIFSMVEDAYQVTLVGAFVPLVFGLYWQKANSRGALWSIILGVSGWLLCKFLNSTTLLDGKESVYWAWIGMPFMEGVMPAQLVGLVLAVAGMVVGSLWKKKV